MENQLKTRIQLDYINIICFADATWNAPLQTNRQQAMRHLAISSTAIRVLFIEPPIFMFSSNRKSKTGDSTKKNNGHILSQELPNLWVMKTPTILPNRI